MSKNLTLPDVYLEFWKWMRSLTKSFFARAFLRSEDLAEVYVGDETYRGAFMLKLLTEHEIHTSWAEEKPRSWKYRISFVDRPNPIVPSSFVRDVQYFYVFDSEFECPKCNGRGFITCYNCNGKGLISCSVCRGSGACPICKGSGYIYTTHYTDYGTSKKRETCYRCGGSGICSVCRGSGTVTCPKCKGSGKLVCSRCQGEGWLIRYVVHKFEYVPHKFVRFVAPRPVAGIVRSKIEKLGKRTSSPSQASSILPQTSETENDIKAAEEAMNDNWREARSKKGHIVNHEETCTFVPVGYLPFSFKGEKYEFWVVGTYHNAVSKPPSLARISRKRRMLPFFATLTNLFVYVFLCSLEWFLMFSLGYGRSSHLP